MQRRRVHNLAGLDKLCAQPVKALFAIYCLTDNDDMRVYLECFKRWSSMARRRVLYEKFLAQHVGVMHHTLLKHSFDKIKDAARQYKECNTYIPKRTKIYAFSKTAILGDFAQLLGQAPVAFEDETQRAIETKHSRRTSRATIRAWQKTRRPDGRSGAGASDNLLWKKLILLLTVAMSHHRSKQLGWTAPIGGKTVHDYGRQRHWLQSKGAIQSKDLAFRSTQAEVKQKETEVREHFACLHLRCLKVLQMWRVDQAAKKVAEALPSMPTVLPPPGPKKAKKGKKGKTKGGDQKVASGSPAVTPAQTPGVVVRDRPPPYPYMMSESEDEDFSDHDEKREYDRTVEVKAWRRYLGGKDYDPEMYRFPEQGGVEKESEGLHYGSCSLLEFRSRPGRVPPFQPNLKTTVMKRKTRKLPPPASGIPVEPSNMAGRPLSMNPDGLVNLVTPGSDVEVSSNKKRPSPHRKIFDGEKDSSVKIWSGVGSGRFDEDGRHRQDDASRAGYLEDISPHKFDSLSAEERVAWEMSEIEKMEHDPHQSAEDYLAASPSQSPNKDPNDVEGDHLYAHTAMWKAEVADNFELMEENIRSDMREERRQKELERAQKSRELAMQKLGQVKFQSRAHVDPYSDLPPVHRLKYLERMYNQGWEGTEASLGETSIRLTLHLTLTLIGGYCWRDAS